ncbi:MAG: hypothetical protein ACREXR_07075 [Gammaproteobacteria bacterium]
MERLSPPLRQAQTFQGADIGPTDIEFPPVPRELRPAGVRMVVVVQLFAGHYAYLRRLEF